MLVFFTPEPSPSAVLPSLIDLVPIGFALFFASAATCGFVFVCGTASDVWFCANAAPENRMAAPKPTSVLLTVERLRWWINFSLDIKISWSRCRGSGE
ncbi:MAG: hypothetical protein CMO32_00050 [Variovorax sp.]|nr:hypothetical protein [Variovorax sp.]